MIWVHLTQSGFWSYPEFLLPVGGHETLLGLLCFGGLLHPFAHLSTLAVDLGLLGLLRLKNRNTLLSNLFYTQSLYTK